jgi:hypothetical protein
MDLVGNDVDTLYEEIEHLVGHLVRNDVNTLYEEKNYLLGFSFIRVYRFHASAWHSHLEYIWVFTIILTRRYSVRCYGDCEKLKMKLSRDDMYSLR